MTAFHVFCASEKKSVHIKLFLNCTVCSLSNRPLVIAAEGSSLNHKFSSHYFHLLYLIQDREDLCCSTVLRRGSTLKPLILNTSPSLAYCLKKTLKICSAFPERSTFVVLRAACKCRGEEPEQGQRCKVPELPLVPAAVCGSSVHTWQCLGEERDVLCQVNCLSHCCKGCLLSAETALDVAPCFGFF